MNSTPASPKIKASVFAITIALFGGSTAHAATFLTLDGNPPIDDHRVGQSEINAAEAH